MNYWTNIQKRCKRCRKHYWVIPSRQNRTKYCSRKCQLKAIGRLPRTLGISRNKGNKRPDLAVYNKLHRRYGRLSPNWKGGITEESKILRARIEMVEWRKAVFNRDNYTCQICKVRGGDLEAHHIKTFKKYPWLSTVIDNGITLCLDCHKTTFRKEEKFEGFFNKIIATNRD